MKNTESPLCSTSIYSDTTYQKHIKHIHVSPTDVYDRTRKNRDLATLVSQGSLELQALQPFRQHLLLTQIDLVLKMPFLEGLIQLADIAVCNFDISNTKAAATRDVLAVGFRQCLRYGDIFKEIDHFVGTPPVLSTGLNLVSNCAFKPVHPVIAPLL